MNTTDIDDFEQPISNEFIQQGYGHFPYVILRMHHAIYMQFPIHFEKEKAGKFPGIYVNMHDEHRKEILYQGLIPAIKQFKSQIDQKSNTSHRLCLVLDKNQAYYFEDGLIKFKNSIPSGGTLVDIKKRFMAMGSRHFTEQLLKVS